MFVYSVDNVCSLLPAAPVKFCLFNSSKIHMQCFSLFLMFGILQMVYVALQAQSCVVLSEINVHNFCKKVAFVYFHIVLPSRIWLKRMMFIYQLL